MNQYSRGASPQPLDQGLHAIDATLRDGVEAPIPHRSTVPARPRSRRCARLHVMSTQVTTCKCGKPVTFEAVPCGCRLACDKCAMKLASGGKCRHCKEWYGGLRRISGGVPSQER